MGLTLLVAMLSGLLGTLPSLAASSPPPSPSADAATVLGPAQVVTLVTGDVLLVSETADGQLVITFERGSQAGAFVRFSDAAGDVHVVPSRLLPLVPERLDPRLFNVSALLRDGYGARQAAADAGPPLIVTYTGAPVTVPGVVTDRDLPSIRGASAVLDPVAPGALGSALARAVSGHFLPGVAKIWLDATMTTSLDESVPQIGAPEVWEQGFDGTDVTIAVVDTGIDETHPDLAGRVVAAELFAEADSVTDVFGHGTHVASIAAGTGAASDGRYSGVAYGADLVSAKVLDDSGSGLESWVIDGMEWAAIDQDADIVNMSINGGYSDGTDLVSQAVDTLSVDENALFVAAAGNFGGAAETVETPASAAAALAVGAVDKSDALAYFSAWGPLLGGTAVKPEIVAPGVAITAARAAGSEIGMPVGDDYMELDGTSMAAPHVAGAAALLLDAHPDWTWDQLKNALVTSAVDVGAGAYQQGGGRVDVPAAVAQTVHSDLATIDLGALEFPHDDGETSSVVVTLTNAGDADVTLDLSTVASSETGEIAPAGMVTAAPATLDLASGESGAVTVIFDASAGPVGRYSGELTAAASGVESLHVPLAFEAEQELFDLTVEVLDRSGGDQLNGLVTLVEVATGAVVEFYPIGPDANVLDLSVEAGTYSVLSMSAQGNGDAMDLVDVSELELVVADDTQLVLDSRDAVPATYVLEESEAGLVFTALSSTRVSEDGSVVVAPTIFGFVEEDGDLHTFAKPTEPVSLGEYQLYLRWDVQGSEIYYDIVEVERAGIPADLTYAITRDDVAEVTSELARDEPGTYSFGYAGLTEFGGIGLGIAVPAPGARVDWLTTDGLEWAATLTSGDALFVGEFSEVSTVYEPGDSATTRWLSRPVRPAVIPAQFAPARYDDVLSIAVLTFVDPALHYGFSDPGFEGPSVDDVSYTLSADGVLIAEGTDLLADVAVDPAPAEYELTLDTTRTADWWLTSTSTSTTWRFTSEQPTGPEPANLSMHQVDYGIDLDLSNHALETTTITFRPYNLAERDDADASVTDFAAWWSADDGATWIALDLTDLGDGAYSALVDVEETTPVSLRVEVADEDGSTFEQEIIRAYNAGDVPPPTTAPPTTAPPTTPPGTTTPVPPTSTLPNTGGGNAGSLTGYGLVVLLIGAVTVIVARRRLRAA